MVKPFNDFVFNNPVGKIGLVETDFGFHFIQIGDKQDGVRLATIAQKIEASELAIHALQLLQSNNISQLIVTDNQKYAGFVHLHDLIKEGII